MLTPENVKKMSEAIRDKAKEIVPNYPNCGHEPIFEKMPVFYKLVKEELNLLPPDVTFDMFWQAAVIRFQMMKRYAGYGFF